MKISIIIQTLNEEKILEKTLKSLRKYHGDYEIIVSDGKSTDKTIEIAKRYTDKVVLYEGQTRQTIGMGRNLGASVAIGDFFLFLDADMNIPSPDDFFQKAIFLFENNPKLVGLTVYLKVFPEVATISDRIITWIFNKVIFIYNNIIHSGASPGEFQMIRANAFKTVNGFDDKLVTGEDFDMFTRLSRVGLTRSEPSLFVFHTARRAHKIGWPRLLYLWASNSLRVLLSGRSGSTVWEEIR